MKEQIKPHRILIVDDTPVNLDVLRVILTGQGYQVTSAANGIASLESVRSDPPDLILLDIMMPEMSGYEVCRILKSDERTSRIPVIFISALSEIKDIVMAFEAGGVDYIIKPFKMEEVLARVNTQLELLEAVREKEESHLLLQTIFDSIENTIVTVDDQLQIINTNRPLDKICPGMSGDRVSFQERIGRGTVACVQPLLQTLETRKPVKEYRVKCNCEGGAERTLVLNTAPLIRKQNELGGAVLVIRDVTRLVELENTLLSKHSYHNIIGKSEKMRKIYDLLERTAELDVNVLICGANGTGKELIADAIHYAGNRSAHPLIKVNCAALSENLLESELFGHVRGSFTGAVKDRVGRIQAAEGGTLFLDEIGDTSPLFQAKLLRFLEHREFEVVGDSETRKADVRVIAATNQDLSAKVGEKRFREDLFYRLKGLMIQLPPLRERVEDIPLLASHFIGVFREALKKNIEGMDENVRKIFLEYHWPGNVRELKSTLHYACALCDGELIRQQHLPEELLSESATLRHFMKHEDPPGSTRGTGPEKETICATLESTDWNKAKTARLLGISRATLYTKILKYGIGEKTGDGPHAE
ncbi:MAG: sigma 54-interacting transcriptional regulator [Proteobacteria bacterium]|nr:sigma 54-interacting transcriptional regulator [Pseudomonadota bacterium]MBU1737233.1 sigma 54-interacting transcriptional regulator [Pseudomonadota bacterium]